MKFLFIGFLVFGSLLSYAQKVENLEQDSIFQNLRTLYSKGTQPEIYDLIDRVFNCKTESLKNEISSEPSLISMLSFDQYGDLVAVVTDENSIFNKGLYGFNGKDLSSYSSSWEYARSTAHTTSYSLHETWQGIRITKQGLLIVETAETVWGLYNNDIMPDPISAIDTGDKYVKVTSYSICK